MLVAAILLMSTLSPSAVPLEKAPGFVAARERYEDFEFVKALQAFEAIENTASINDADRARLLVWIGMCHAEEGALVLAMRRFEAAAALDPDVAPLATMSPKARKMLDDARRRAPPRRTLQTGDAAPPPTLEVPVDDVVAPVDDPRPVHPALIGGVAAIGVGIVAVAVATAAGVAANAAASDAQASPSAADAALRYQGAQQLALTANAGFVIAAVGVAAGVAGIVVGVSGD